MKNKTKIFTAIILLLALIPALLVSIYSRSCVDDFNYSYMTYHSFVDCPYNIFGVFVEALKTDWQFYNHWQGLYSSAFILSLQPGIFSPKVYFLGTILLLLIIFFCTYYTFSTFRSFLYVKKSTIALFALLLTGFFCQFMPSPIEGLYWFNGAYNDVPFFFLTLVNMSVLYKGCTAANKRYIYISMILSFLISGGNHVCSFMNILLLGMNLLLWCRKKLYARYISYSLVMAVIGFAIMYWAPGTAVRQGTMSNATVPDTLIQSLKFMFTHHWFNAEWILISLSTIIFVTFFVDSSKRRKMHHPLFITLGLFIIFWGMLCVPYYPMQCFGAGRVMHTFLFAFTSCTRFIIAYTTLYIKIKTGINIKRNKYTNILGTILLLVNTMYISFSSSNLAHKAVAEMKSGTAQAFANAFDERLVMMSEAKERNSIEVLKFKPLPQSELLRFDDLSANVDDWRNVAWYQYYGIKCIVNE